MRAFRVTDEKMRFLALVVCAACGYHPGVAPGDAARDAPADTTTAAPPRKGAETVSGAGRLHAGAIQLDVEIGHGVPVKQSTAGTTVISGAPVVKP